MTIVDFSAQFENIELPLVLISQIQRSGGTLLSQLFDGHPQVLAFPSELHVAKPEWPNVVDALPDVGPLLGRHDRVFSRFVESGYQKFSIIDEGDRFPFDYDLELRDSVLNNLLSDKDVPGNRDFFNAFFTAFFTAWRSRRTQASQPRCIVAFAPRTNMHLARQTEPAFFSDYPDGQLITLVRQPQQWFSSARRHQPRYSVFQEAMELWIESTRSSLDLHRRFPQQVILLAFEALVSSTRTTMAFLCDRLGLAFDPIVCTPTFDGIPIKSDSNFKPAYGVDSSVLIRSDFVPEREEDRHLLAETEHLYEEAASMADHELQAWSRSRSVR